MCFVTTRCYFRKDFHNAQLKLHLLYEKPQCMLLFKKNLLGSQGFTSWQSVLLSVNNSYSTLNKEWFHKFRLRVTAHQFQFHRGAKWVHLIGALTRWEAIKVCSKPALSILANLYSINVANNLFWALQKRQ